MPDIDLGPIIKWLEHQRFAIDRYDGTGTTPPHEADIEIVASLVTEVQSLSKRLRTAGQKLRETKTHSLILERGWDTGAVAWVAKSSGRGFRLACRGCGIGLGPTMKSKEDDDDKA